jgi:hypothetical protein
MRLSSLGRQVVQVPKFSIGDDGHDALAAGAAASLLEFGRCGVYSETTWGPVYKVRNLLEWDTSSPGQMNRWSFDSAALR